MKTSMMILIKTKTMNNDNNTFIITNEYEIIKKQEKNYYLTMLTFSSTISSN